MGNLLEDPGDLASEMEEEVDDGVEDSAALMIATFPNQFARYMADVLSAYVDFTSWMMWGDDGIPYSEEWWRSFPLNIRTRLVQEGHTSYAVPLPPHENRAGGGRESASR